MISKINGLLRAVCASSLLVISVMDVGLLIMIAVAESWLGNNCLFFSLLSS